MKCLLQKREVAPFLDIHFLVQKIAKNKYLFLLIISRLFDEIRDFFLPWLIDKMDFFFRERLSKWMIFFTTYSRNLLFVSTIFWQNAKFFYAIVWRTSKISSATDWRSLWLLSATVWRNSHFERSFDESWKFPPQSFDEVSVFSRDP